MPPLPSISSVPSLPTERRAHILDILFEPSTQLHTLSITTLQDTTFPSYAFLISAIRDQLTTLLNSPSTSDSDWLDAILSAHPRLGEKKVESELSQGEQAQLQGGEEEAEKLAGLNWEYESKFPGLRYVYVCLSQIPCSFSDCQLHRNTPNLQQGVCQRQE
jgi:OHCU decarboxylase